MSALTTAQILIQSIAGAPIRWVNFWSFAHSTTPKLVTPSPRPSQSKKPCVQNQVKHLQWQPSWLPMLRLVDFPVAQMCPRAPDGHRVKKLIWNPQSLLGTGKRPVGLNRNIHSCCQSIMSVIPNLMATNSWGAWTYWVTCAGWVMHSDPHTPRDSWTLPYKESICAMPVVTTIAVWKTTMFPAYKPRFWPENALLCDLRFWKGTENANMTHLLKQQLAWQKHYIKCLLRTKVELAGGIDDRAARDFLQHFR